MWRRIRSLKHPMSKQDIVKGEPYQFTIDEINANKIMEVYDYEWTDEKIQRKFKLYARSYLTQSMPRY